MSAYNFTTKLLANRWRLRPATLRQWRWFNKGPRSFKIGGKTLYSIEEVERFEENALRNHTTITDDMELDFSNHDDSEESKS